MPRPAARVHSTIEAARPSPLPTADGRPGGKARARPTRRPDGATTTPRTRTHTARYSPAHISAGRGHRPYIRQSQLKAVRAVRGVVQTRTRQGGPQNTRSPASRKEILDCRLRSSCEWCHPGSSLRCASRRAAEWPRSPNQGLAPIQIGDNSSVHRKVRTPGEAPSLSLPVTSLSVALLCLSQNPSAPPDSPMPRPADGIMPVDVPTRARVL